MARRQSKADLILSEARERVEVARVRLAEANAEVRIAEALFNAHERALHTLQYQLAPKPRKKVVKEKEPEKLKGAMCNVCANPEDHPDHDMTYLSSHPFVFPGVASAGKKSGRKSEGKKSTANSETPLVDVSNAAHAGS